MEYTCQLVLFDRVEHLDEFEAGHHPDLKAEAEGHGDVDCEAACVGCGEDAWEGELKALWI